MYFIDFDIYKRVVETLRAAPVESGGILGIKDNVICAYCFDDTYNSYSEYVPNTDVLNDVIDRWHDEGIDFIGIVHSHPNSYNKPSEKDLIYLQKLVINNDFLTRIIFPIVTKEEKCFKITFYEFKNKFSLVGVKIKL